MRGKLANLFIVCIKTVLWKCFFPFPATDWTTTTEFDIRILLTPKTHLWGPGASLEDKVFINLKYFVPKMLFKFYSQG